MASLSQVLLLMLRDEKRCCSEYFRHYCSGYEVRSGLDRLIGAIGDRLASNLAAAHWPGALPFAYTDGGSAAMPHCRIRKAFTPKSTGQRRLAGCIPSAAVESGPCKRAAAAADPVELRVQRMTRRGCCFASAATANQIPGYS